MYDRSDTILNLMLNDYVKQEQAVNMKLEQEFQILSNWIQNKLNGRSGSKKSSLISATDHKLQEPLFSDKHHGLLAIGTLGNKNLKDHPPERSINLEGNPSSSQDDHLQEFTSEELGKLQNELNLLLHCSVESEANNHHQLDKSLDRESNSKDSSIQRSTSNIVLNSTGKDDVCLENTKGGIGKKSLSFVLKKMFVCRSGLPPAPSLRDPLTESRMEKILRAILHKKIYPQSSSSAALKYLENRHMPKSSHDEDDELNFKADNGSKWVKTDSEYIVLEF
ncbi:protein NEGATIVE GRAVITROPIC RESPONSE OF ROOTS-like [Alnus glutinosa]|uniref:protein NEGATIVE GRAVITROPIC RESPONSE OF ROOTS-like n=1 Tax=Alnus glutinosa TaxID=3517 RepID=UPI002D784C0C|nr:protein NEGATIVE GRAVITROPIC RESPONSE OF ROOTS-like [Alnus glutinosa]